MASEAKGLSCKFYFAEFQIEIAMSLMAMHSDCRVVSCVFVAAAKRQK